MQVDELVYGSFTALEALMTCLTFPVNDDHTHFVNGSDGNHALAAKQLKQRLANINKRKSITKFNGGQ